MTNKELIDKIRNEILHLKMKELQRTNGINTGADVYLSSYAVLSILSNALTEESEDERIRKEMISFLRSPFIKENLTDEKVAPWLAYLEKQKEPTTEELYAEAGTTEKEYIANTMKKVRAMRERKKEQKPELVQQPPITYTYKSNASRDERLKAALLALLNSDLLKVKEGGYFTKQDLIEWVERIPTDKPAEWSEEDADILNCCISSIEEAKENRYAYKETDGDTSYDREIDWLKSLRPSWKPSDQDELMKLKYAGTSTKLD